MTREEFMDIVYSELHSDGDNYRANRIIDAADEYVEDSSSENPNKWIPVSERLPEDGELILFSTKTDCVYEGRYFDDNTHCQWYSFRDDTFAWNNVVTAWMPLPQPYKEESEEDWQHE